VSTPRPINVADYEQLAEACCEPGHWGYVVGGAGDETTLRDNLEAFRRRILRPRMLVDVSGGSARTTVLGTEIELPVMVAPTSLQRVAHPEGEPALARAAAAGEDGARDVLELLGAEIWLALLLLGCPRPGDVGPQHVAARG
jgi:isopentenyl diphosphate isomerase/L-lactate dehydrogenase-like FMN-dependent dehydrogenase